MSINLKQNIWVFFSLFFLMLAIAYNVLTQYNLLDRPLNWDEVDYIQAARKGVVKNAFENGSLSFFQLAELGKAKLQMSTFSTKNFPQEFEDVFTLRHFHHPLPVYFWNSFVNDDISRQDVLARISNIVLSLLCALIFFVAAFGLFSQKENVQSHIAIISCLAVFVSCNLFIGSFYELNFHTFFLLVTLYFVLCLISYLQQPSKRKGVWLAFAATAVFCTLETSVFVFAGAIVGIYFLKQSTSLKLNLRRNLFLFILFSVILWPGVLRTLGPLKSWAMYAYRIFAMKNVAYEQVSVLTTLKNILSENILVSVIIICGYARMFYNYRKDKSFDKLNFIPGIIGLVYFLLILPFTISNTYILPAVALLLLGCIPGIISLMKFSYARYIFPSVCFASVLTLFLTADFIKLKNNSLEHGKKFQDDLTELKTLFQYDGKVLADGGRIFKYYLPQHADQFTELFRFNMDSARFAVRENYQYVQVDSLLEKKYYRGIIIGKQRNYTRQQFDKLQHWGYNLKELNNYYLFYR